MDWKIDSWLFTCSPLSINHKPTTTTSFDRRSVPVTYRSGLMIAILFVIYKAWSPSLASLRRWEQSQNSYLHFLEINIIRVANWFRQLKRRRFRHHPLLSVQETLLVGVKFHISINLSGLVHHFLLIGFLREEVRLLVCSLRSIINNQMTMMTRIIETETRTITIATLLDIIG